MENFVIFMGTVLVNSLASQLSPCDCADIHHVTSHQCRGNRKECSKPQNCPALISLSSRSALSVPGSSLKSSLKIEYALQRLL